MNLETRSFLILLVAVTLAFLALLADFAQPIFWAAALAVIFHPVHVRILARVGRRESLAALLTLLVIILTVLLPLGFILSAVVNEATILYGRIESGEIGIDQPLEWLRTNVPALST